MTDYDPVAVKALRDLHKCTWGEACKMAGIVGVQPESVRRRCGIAAQSKDAPPIPSPTAADVQVAHDRIVSELKHALQEKTRLYDQALKDLNYQEQLITLGADTIKALPLVSQPCLTSKARACAKTDEDAVLNLGDLHYGEVVRHQEMGGLNEFNCAVANLRLKALAEIVCDLVANKLAGYSLPRCHVNMLGDMVSGMIHDEFAETNDRDIVTLTVDLAYILAQMVRELLLVFPKADIACVVGNHGRMCKKPRFKGRHVNWDYLCYQFMSLFLGNEIKAKRVTCNVPQSFWVMKPIRGHNWLVMHGDNIKGWAGVPWYGIIRATHKLKELVATQRDFIDYIVLGHFHNAGTLDMMKGEIIINGSIKGGDEYSVGKLYSISQPSQLFCGVHAKHGITWRYQLNLKDRPIHGEPYKTADLGAQCVGRLVADMDS